MPGIDISANTQSAQAALKQLEQAFKQLLATGKKFTELDLADLGTDQLGRDLKAIVDQWNRIANARGSAIRGSQQSGKAPWEVDLRAAHPTLTSAQIQKKLEEMIESLLHGVSGNSPGLPRPPDRISTPSGNAARDEENRQRQAIRDQHTRDTAEQRAKQHRDQIAAQEERESQQRRAQLIGGITGGMKFGLGLAGVQTGMDAIQTGYQGANDINKYTDEFMRRTKDVGNGFEFLRGQITHVGQGLGVAGDEAAKLTLAFTRTAHAATIEDAKAGTDAAIGLAAGFGADKGQTVQQMAGMSLIGATGNSMITPRDKKFALILAQAIGHNNVPLEKAMGDFSRLAESSAARTGNAPPTEAIAGYLKSLYDVAEKHPGLKGSSGLSLLQAADEGLKNNNSPAMMMTMFEGLSPLMGTKNFLQILKQKEKGGLAPVTNTDGTPLLNADGTESDATNVSVFLKGMRKNYGNIDPLALAMRTNEELNMGGIGRAEQFIKISDTYKGGVTGYKKDLAKHGIEMEKLDTSGIKDVKDILEAKPSERFDVAQSKLQKDFAKPLSDEERKRLEGLRNEASGGDPAKQEAFISAMIKTSAEHGMMATPYSQMETTLADIKNVLIEQVGRPITDGFSLVAGFLQKQFGYTPEKQKAEKEYTTAQQASRAVHEKANTAIDAAQAEVDNAPPGSPERAEALKKLEETQQSWKPAKEAIKKNKIEKYKEDRGWWQEFFDKTFGLLTMAPDGDQPYGINESPEESRNTDDLRTQLQQKKLREEFKKPFNWIFPEANKESQKITEQAAQDLKALDTPDSAPVRRATGGLIPGGFGGGDRVPAMLTPGEFVINAGATQKHQNLLNQINSGNTPVPLKFADGGLVPNGAPATNSLPGATTVLNDGDDTPATVKELQKRLEQLFDPVTRYLAELAQGARALQAGHGKSGTGMAAVMGAGKTAVTTPDGTPIAPLSDAARFEAQKGLTTGKTPAVGAYPPVTMPSVHNFTGQTFHGNGMGFMSPGTASARERFEHRSDFVGPLNPKTAQGAVGDAGSTSEGMGTPSAKAAREGSAGAQPSLDSPSGSPPNAASRRSRSGALYRDPKVMAHMADMEKKYGLPSGLLYGVMTMESNGNANARSPVGASGPFQFMPGTASRFGIAGKANDPYASSEAAAKYLAANNKMFKGNWDDTIASYNAGEGTVQKVKRGERNYKQETKNYVPGVKYWANQAPYREDATTATPTPVPPPAPDATSKPSAKAAKADTDKEFPNSIKLPNKEEFEDIVWGDKAKDFKKPIPKADNPEYTPKPKEPIPEPTMQQTSTGQGIGHLDIVMRQQDAYGATIGQDVNHRMSLRSPRPTGRMSVAAVNHSSSGWNNA